MKFTEINAIFSEKVAKYLNEGYVLHPYTMAGHQGEIAKVDLTNGKEIIRVWLDTVNCDSYHFRQGIALTVGRSTNERLLNPRNYRWSDTLWNNDCEVVEQRVFWQMVREYREVDFYIEGDEGLEAVKKTDERAKVRYSGTGMKVERMPENTYRIALKLLRKIPGHKNKRMADIEGFYRKEKLGEKAKYVARVKGHDVALA